ncbi:hypothetical protein [Marilutibacter spongiae]|uniref:Uncharacterized protein n=1 Tax=Marilutibacter spongiae TaxID=2025720 RepID=A0A7W3Y7A0_9GAMM|nr:hypothetical protein [Lysobacter spongiae]MBB1062072.1 hypothetical protein [Lysobacter spongiae]
MSRAEGESELGGSNDRQGEQSEIDAYRSVLGALRELRPNDLDVALKLKDTKIRVLGNRTLEEAILEGDSDKAMRYLQSISGGQNG